jgi:hypothetical protein
MLRKARYFDLKRFFEDYPDLDNKKVELWIDCDAAVEVLRFIFEKDSDNNYKRRRHFFVILKPYFKINMMRIYTQRKMYLIRQRMLLL